MSHWFHRNPLKATAPQMFEVKMFAHDSEALKIISDLRQSRARLLELLPDPHHTIEQMETALKLYMALLRGFLLQPGQTWHKTEVDSVFSSLVKKICRLMKNI